MNEGTPIQRAERLVRRNYDEIHDTAQKETAFLQRRRGPFWGGFGEGKLKKSYRIEKEKE